jgi:hypothetical protein
VRFARQSLVGALRVPVAGPAALMQYRRWRPMNERQILPVSLALAASVLCASGILRGAAHQEASPEANAVAFLAREVPSWRREHPCYSCHNNGDAARALIAAARRGHDTREALADTIQWLSEPHRWDTNARGGGFEDLTLARIQFASALTEARQASMSPPAALAAAAAIVAADQQEDGAWRLDDSHSIGSPATYGTALATWAARRTLVAASRAEDARLIARADRWLRASPVATVLDAAATLLGLDRADDSAARTQRERCLAIIGKGQGPDGGWGPYVTAPSEPFDTAVVLLALNALDPAIARGWQAAIDRGRQYLVANQLADGSWQETTRPARQESYAQRISTTAWAALALFSTAPSPGDLKRKGEALGDGQSIDPFEPVDLERPADAIAGKVLEDR